MHVLLQNLMPLGCDEDEPEFRRCIAAKAVTRFKHRVRVLTARHRGLSLERLIGELIPYLRGWGGYFVPITLPAAKAS